MGAVTRILRDLPCRRTWRPHDCPISPKGHANGYRDGDCPCREALHTGKTVAEWRAEQGQPRGDRQLSLLVGGK